MSEKIPMTVRDWCDLEEIVNGRTLSAKFCIEECENRCYYGELVVNAFKEGLSYEEIEEKIGPTIESLRLKRRRR